MMSLSRENQSDIIESFNSTSRYLDDLLNIDNIYTERKKKRRVEFFPSYFNHFYDVYYSHTLLQIVL